jgi:probable phosphoglycerate mutase
LDKVQLITRRVGVRLILIRHGESYASVEQTIADVASCKGLTQQGFAQVELLANRLRDTGEFDDCTLFLSSPIPRARQTAESLLDVLPVPVFGEEPDLRDLIPGEAEGLTNAAYEAQFGRFNLRDYPDRPFSPNGESWTTFTARIRQTLHRFTLEYAGQTVVATCHAGFIVIALLEIFAIPRPGTRAWLNPSYTGITELDFSDNRWCLVRYNDTSHLNQKR